MQTSVPNHLPAPVDVRVPSRRRGDFTAQLTQLDPTKLYAHLNFRTDFSDRDLVIETILGAQIDHGTILAYLFRRFGYPNSAWDRDLAIARYVLTTPNPAMLLCIEPHISGFTTLGFSFMVDARLMPTLGVGNRRPTEFIMWSKKDPLRPLTEAARETLEDLLTPVQAGVMAINVQGYAGEEGTPLKPCAAAGYPSGALGNAAPAEVCELQRLIAQLGGGDAKAGVQKALSILKAASVPTDGPGLA